MGCASPTGSTQPITEIPLVAGDTKRILNWEYDGQDITGWTIELHIAYLNKPLVKIATISDPLTGKFYFSFDKGDLQAGRWSCEVEFRDALGKEFTVDGILLDIHKKIFEGAG